MFYDKFITLCAEKGVAPSRVALDLNLTTPAVTRWKNGANPNDLNLRKIADYFNVPVSYFDRSKETNTRSSSSQLELKGDFYSLFVNLCKQKGVSPSYAANNVGLSRAAVGRWKNGGTVPYEKTVKKIADYFGVPMSYFYEDTDRAVDTNPFYVKIEKLCEATGTTVDGLINKLPEDVGKTIKYKGTVKKPSDLQRIARYFGINREYFRDYIPIEPLPQELDKAQTANSEVIEKEPADFSIDKLPENTDREKLIKRLMQQADELTDDKLRKLIALIELSK